MHRKRTLTVLFASIITLSIVTFSYAYFQSGVSNTNKQTALVTAGTMKLTFSDDDNGIGAVMNFGDTITKKFTIENSGSLDAYARVSWLNMLNTYLEGSLIYTLEYFDEENNEYKILVNNQNIPRSEVITTLELIDGILIPANTTYHYNLYITLVNSSTIDQTADLNASFNTMFRLEVGSSDSYQTLIALGLENSIQSEPTNYNMFNYTYNGFYGNTDTEPTKEIGTKTTEGLYMTLDDYGISYYFRGSKLLNNIVEFGEYDEDMYSYGINSSDSEIKTIGNLEQCRTETINIDNCDEYNKIASAGDKMYWRIVRINGDGTLRLLYIGTSPEETKSSIGATKYNNLANNVKYTGYTYDNSAPDIQDGTDSIVKNYIDTWYERTMSTEDNHIAIAQFYCDTSDFGDYQNFNDLFEQIYQVSANIYKHATVDRLEKYSVGATENIKPSLKTKKTNQLYGGTYYLKAGMLNADEATFIGFNGLMGVANYSENYIYYPFVVNKNREFWLMSAAVYMDMHGLDSLATGATAFIISTTGNIIAPMVYNVSALAPVINLTVDTAQQLIGSGSANDPYRLPEKNY